MLICQLTHGTKQVNGYLDYDWSDLATVGIQQNLVTLGWTEDSWNGVDIPPASENLFFAELDSDEQAAAEAICFFQERWDGLPLTDYAEDPRTKPVGCFAATNTVVTQNKGTIAISQLEIGDYVQDSYSTYSRVYSLSHVDRTAKAEIVSIELDNGENNPLELTADHMVYANGVRPVRAQDVVVGDILGQNSRVVKISKVQREGVYAPLTESGSIVVSGVVSSCYMAMVDGFSPYFQHLIAQAATAPLRMTCTMNFSICQHETYTAGRSNFFWKIIQVVERFGGLPVLCQLAVAVLVAAPLGSLCLLELCMEWQIVRCSALVAVMVWLLRKRHQQQALREGNKKAL